MPAIFYLSLPSLDETTRMDPVPQMKHEAVSGTTGRHPFDDPFGQSQLRAEPHDGGSAPHGFRLLP